jgi:L-asparaginase
MGSRPGLGLCCDLVSAVPAIKKIAQIQVEQISNIPSHDITPEIWLRLAGRVNELLARPEIAGLVVTHGTDTLEETAYFLDLTTASTKPVILVGAQRPASDPDSDGPRNLLNAIRVAVASEATGKGVMVAINGQINAARDVTKTNTSQVETFRGLEFGALGVVDEEKVRFYRLGGHLKTGHRRTLQNRPTERNQNKTIYTLREGAQANIFVRLGLAGLY